MELRYSRWQTPRGARPDAIRGLDRYLIKNVTRLRLTYQIRLLTLAAEEEGGRLVIRVPRACRLSNNLRQLAKVNKKRMRIERV
jgi:hypothetical protein